MERFEYAVRLVPAEEGGFIVSCRDLPQLVTQGGGSKLPHIAHVISALGCRLIIGLEPARVSANGAASGSPTNTVAPATPRGANRLPIKYFL